MIPTTWWEDLLTWWESGTWEDRPFLGAMPNPSLGWFLLVGCCLSCLGSFFFLFLPFLGAMPNPSLGCFLLVGCCLSCLGSFFFVFFFWPFLGAMPNPSLGCFLLVGCCLRKIDHVFWSKKTVSNKPLLHVFFEAYPSLVVIKWQPLLNGTGCLVESCWFLKTFWKYENIS